MSGRTPRGGRDFEVLNEDPRTGTRERVDASSTTLTERSSPTARPALAAVRRVQLTGSAAMTYVPPDPVGPLTRAGAPGAEPASYGPPTVLVVTGSAHLRDQVHLVAATLGVGVRVDPPARVDPLHWARARLVVLGPDAAADDLPGPRPGIVVLATDEAPAVAGLDAELVRLPQGLPRLETLLAGGGGGGLVVGVIGALGGVGVSTLSVALALAAQDVLLIDADPLGPGLQAGLGWEDLPGARWPELDATQGRVRAGALREALPGRHGVRLITYDRGSPAVPVGSRPVRLLDVVAAGRQAFAVVVVDLPRRAEAADLLVWRELDCALVVTRSGVAGAVAAARLCETLRALTPRVGAVLRPQSAGLDERQIADVLRVQRVVEWPEQRGLTGAAEAGDLARSLRRGRTARLGAELLAWAGS